MSSQAYMAALEAPDDNASHEKLYALAVKGPVASRALSKTAEEYLRVFCNNAYSRVRRRWVGLALSKMLQTSSEVAKRLGSLSSELAQVGNIILSKSEAEETRVVAGLVIREGLSRGIPFQTFWQNERVPEPSFPKTGADWMFEFQGFVDALHLKFDIHSDVDALIIYPVSLFASDAYRWFGETRPVLLAQGDLLTIVTPGASLQHIDFIDVPLCHIDGIHRQRSELHDSQNIQTELEPWETVIKLTSDEWTYQVNSTARNGDIFTIMLEHEKDAEEVQTGLNSFMDPSAVETLSSESDMDVTQQTTKQRRGYSPPPLDRANKEMAQDNPPTVPSQQKQNMPSNIDSKSPPKITRRKAGTLPVIHRPFIGKKSQESATDLDVYDEFDFPEQSPKVKRLTVAKRKTTPNSAPSTKAASQGKPARVTKAKPTSQKAKARTKQQDTDDDEDPIAKPPRSSTDAPSSSLEMGKNGAVKKQAKNSRDLPKLSKLPKTTKSRLTQSDGALEKHAIDFRIPEDDDAEHVSKPRSKRESTNMTAYKETSSEEESDENNSSGSEYGERHRRDTKAHKSRKTVPSSTSNTAALTRKARTSSVTARHTHTQPPSLLSNLLPKSRSSTRRKTKPKDRTGKDVDERNAVPVADEELVEPPVLADPTLPISEVNIVDQLNTNEGDNTRGALNRGSTRQSLKRPLEDSSPSTPRTKRTRKAIDVVPTNAPQRVLKEPSSPCVKQRHHLTDLFSHQVHGMQPPPNPKAEQVEQGAAPSVRQRNTTARRTPVHRNSRSPNVNSATVELLSSNSKPTPASPHAESTAISGHADPRRVSEEKELADYEIAKNDPFQRQSARKPTVTAFTRRLTAENATAMSPEQWHGASQTMTMELGNTSSSNGLVYGVNTIPAQQTAAPNATRTWMKDDEQVSVTVEKPTTRRSSRNRTVETVGATAMQPDLGVEMSSSIHNPTQQSQQDHFHYDMDIDGDTLIDQVNLPSSPPNLVNCSRSSHSSTSAEPEPRTDPPMPTSEANEMEWERSLLPHQRALSEQLLRVSKRVLRHVVDNETAVHDIADTYQMDGQRLLQNLADQHDGEMAEVSAEMNKKQNKMRKSCDRLLNKLAREQEEVRTYDI
ncbi:hypothetical protein P280DRAFT_505077 [Massarina eburnea CBS 473.64]|uniref:Uncharacterized protein n=1 Tax=Massarina eburnea CBS 473.64 TaxID=1395130 RepID=A0A6A6S9J5_9PLEO|nr:hypothetical protein P280DRAFT_505077 [Massarina eburnea CBS 473.64]